MRAWKRKNDELTLQNQNLIYSLTGMQENIAVLKEEVEKVEEFKTEIKRLNKRN